MPYFFQKPPLTLNQAHVLNCLFTLGYVIPLYLTKYTRPSWKRQISDKRSPQERWRDHPKVIRARLLCVTISTAASIYYVHALISRLKGEEKDMAAGWNASLPRLGLTFHKDNVLSYLVTPALFLGPLYVRYISSELPFMRRWSFKEDVIKNIFTWQGIRNYVVGPITEELVWRSCILAVYHLAGASKTTMIFLSPVSFGSAHFHHAWENYDQNGRTKKALKLALLMTLFQFIYTTIFGAHCAFLLLRTGSVFPAIVAHIFCNFMGLPHLQQELKWYRGYGTRIKAAYALGILTYIYTMHYWTLSMHSLLWYANDGQGW